MWPLWHTCINLSKGFLFSFLLKCHFFVFYQGASCRTRVTKHLSRQFKSLSEAEEALSIDYITNSSLLADTHFESTPRRSASEDYSTCPLSPIFSCSPTKGTDSLDCSNVGDIVKQFLISFKCSMSSQLKRQLLHYIFKLLVVESDGLDFFKFVNSDFLTTSLSGMKTLFKHEKSNLIFDLSKCFEGDSLRMPLDRMPYGLLDYNIRFFARESTVNVGMEEHYASWLETMFAQFGHKWLCLHRGPVWQYESSTETDGPLENVVNQSETSIGMDVAEVDIIQEALQQSSIDLDADHEVQIDSDTLELVNTSICNLSISVDEVPTCFSSTNHKEFQNTSSILPSPKSTKGAEDQQHVSHLWTSLSKMDMCEMELGLVSSREMEKCHKIQPSHKASKRRNPDIFNPLKVCRSLLKRYAYKIQY